MGDASQDKAVLPVVYIHNNPNKQAFEKGSLAWLRSIALLQCVKYAARRYLSRLASETFLTSLKTEFLNNL
ncbi:MAG TPA: hypothetical protein VI750_02800 [Pyrinomonadaceae bacterium]|nr:hypothetical protein [Pyrinomonadaceae bacterium]